MEWAVACKRSRVLPSSLLNVYWGASYELATIRRLPRRCFDPPPSVDAGILRIVRRERPLVPGSEARAYRALLEAAFAGERVVHGPWLKRVVRELGVDPAVRAHELDVFQWAALFDAVRGRR